MSKPWNKVCLAKEEPNLLEIMSEELCNRLHVDTNFIWVDIPELHQVENVTISADLESEFEFITKEPLSLLSAATVADVTQFTVKGEGYRRITEESEESHHEQDYEWEERQESDYFEEFDHVKVKPIVFSKLRYPRPQRSKYIEHGTTRIYSGDKIKNINERNKLLPKIIFDASTTAVLEKLIENRYLGQYNDVIGKGKNSFVFNADCHRRVCMTMTVNNAVKVYKMGNNDENNKLVLKRVEREFDHLNILNKHNKRGLFDCPWPVRASRNVIVMSFIGFNQTVAPSIQDIPFEKDCCIYYAVINFMDRCYNIAHLVHGKLSPKKILYQFEKPYFIGWSHSVKRDHPLALSKLMRDCKFVTEFYAKRGLNVKSTEDLFKEITKVSRISSKLLEIINKNLYEKYDTNPNRSSRPTKAINKRTLRFKQNLSN